MKIIFFVIIFLLSDFANASCVLPLEVDSVKIDRQPILDSSLEHLIIQYPEKTLESWPLKTVFFEYHYDGHQIKLPLNGEKYDDSFISKIRYSSEFNRSVQVHLRYLDPNGECEKFFSYYGYDHT